MTKKENNILPKQVFDFTIFPIGEPENILNSAAGSNQAKLLVVYATETQPKEDLDFLKKILSAVKIDLDKDVLLINTTAQQRFSFSSLKTFGTFKKLLVFGKQARDLGIHITAPQYQVTQIAGCQMLFADSLDQIALDNNKKGVLWGALKEIFPS